MAFEHLKDMHDDALKPRMLERFIRDLVPADKNPSWNQLELSRAVSLLKIHSLLSESVQDTTNHNLIARWRSAVDSWVDRLLLLASSDMPDKCWAGLCLIGVTCQECSSDRFLASYSVWFQKLLSSIQSSSTSQILKVASCASMSDLLTRLAGFPIAKKDGTAHAGKLILSVLKLLDDVYSEVVWEGAVQLLCICTSLFPFSINRHYNSAEDAIASKILSGKCSVNMLKKLAQCLALLPKSRGDEESWSLMIQKIIYLINFHLNGIFQGFEEERKHHKGIRFLDPPAKDPPPPLGGHTLTGEATEEARKNSHSCLVSSVSALMICCSTMLTSPYPVQVTAPIRSLLALIERVLAVDGSLPHSLRLFMTAMQQEFVCSELPLLHSYGLDLLTEVFRGAHSQILPHAASIVHLLSVYLKRFVVPELRVKVYAITRICLISSGVGVAVNLAQELVNSAIVDLDPLVNELSANAKPSTEALQSQQPSNRKRKHGTSLASQELHNTSALEASKNNPRCSIAVKIAALEALEALLTVGGVWKSEKWRSDVDVLLLNIAKYSSRGGWAGENRNINQLAEPTGIWSDIQLAALRALLASFLSSSRVRSPNLAMGLDLFRRGTHETGTTLAGFCAHALSVLEVLIHPRVLPLADFSNTDDRVHNKFSENVNSSRTPCSVDIKGMGHDAPDSDHDDMCHSWLKNNEVKEAPESDLGKTMQTGEPSKTPTDDGDTMLYVDGSLSEGTVAGIEEKHTTATIEDRAIRRDGNENMVEVPTEKVFERVASENGPPDQAGTSMVSDQVDGIATEGSESLGRDITTSDPAKSKSYLYDLSDDSDLEGLTLTDRSPDSNSE